jgi:hypothetical protein
MISLAKGDERHIVFHLWRREGEGYALILENPTPPLYGDRCWEYCVFQETTEHPRDYDFYSRNNRSAPIYGRIQTRDIKVNQSQDALIEPSISIYVIDIEFEKHTARQVGQPELGMGQSTSLSPPIAEMYRWWQTPSLRYPHPPDASVSGQSSQ